MFFSVNSPSISPENSVFVKEVVNGVFHGEGITWFRNNRLRRLMEDETCRFLTVERVQKTINAKNVSDEHVTDVVSETEEGIATSQVLNSSFALLPAAKPRRSMVYQPSLFSA